MHFLDVGEGEPVVLLHGLGSSSHDWEYQIPVLSERYRVVAPCLRGFGDTEKTGGPHSVKTWSEDVIALLEYLGIDSTHLLGFSMGGAIAFQTAVDHGHRLRSMTIVNSQPSFELNHWTKYMMVLSRIAMARTLGMPRLARYVAKRMFPLPEQAELKQRMIERHSRNDRDSYVNAVNALAGWTVADLIEAIETPTLVLAADKDYTPVEEKDAYVRRMSNARLVVVEDSRHVSHVDQADTLNQAVVDFLEDLEDLVGSENM